MQCSKLSHKINGADGNWKRIVPRAIFFPHIWCRKTWKQGLASGTLFIAMRFLVHSWDFCAFLMGIKGRKDRRGRQCMIQKLGQRLKVGGKIPMDMCAKGAKIWKLALFFPHALSSRRFISASKVGNRTRPSFSVAFLNGGRKSGRAIKFRSQRGQSADRERWLLKSGTPTLWQFELQSGGKIGAIFLMFLRSLFLKNAGTYMRLNLCESQNSRPASIFSSREIMWKLFQN